MLESDGGCGNGCVEKSFGCVVRCSFCPFYDTPYPTQLLRLLNFDDTLFPVFDLADMSFVALILFSPI